MFAPVPRLLHKLFVLRCQRFSAYVFPGVCSSCSRPTQLRAALGSHAPSVRAGFTEGALLFRLRLLSWASSHAVSGLQRVTCVTCPLPFPRPILCALVCTRPMSRWPTPFPSSVRDPTPEPPLRPSITRARFLGLMFTIDPPSCLPVLWRHLPSLLPPCSSVSSMKDNSYVTVPSCPRQCLGRPSTALFLLTVFRRFSARGTVCGNEPWWLGVWA